MGDKPPADAPDPWTEPRPFDPLGERLPPWPWQAYPPVIQEFGQAVTTGRGMASEFPGLGLLCYLSIALANAFTLVIRGNHWCFGNIYGWLGAYPGTGKTQFERTVVAPFEEHRLALMERYAARRAKYRVEAEHLNAQIQALKKHIQDEISEGIRKKSGMPSRIGALKEEQGRCYRALHGLGLEPDEPGVLCSDATSEGIVREQRNNGGFAAIVSSEGHKMLPIIRGRYAAGSADLDAWLRGHSYDTLRIVRAGKPPLVVERPCLAAFVTLQPELLQSLLREEGLRVTGFLARFLYAVPVRHYNVYPTAALPDEMTAKWNSLVAGIFRLHRLGDDNTPDALRVELSPAAFDLWRDRYDRVAQELNNHCKDMPDGFPDWLRRLPDHAARIALIMHVAQQVSEGADPTVSVSAGTMANALTLADHLVLHAQRAFSMMGSDPTAAAAARVWDWCQQNAHTVRARREKEGLGPILAVKVRDITQLEIPDIKDAKEAKAVLNRLEGRGYVQVCEYVTGRAKPQFLAYLNPVALSKPAAVDSDPAAVPEASCDLAGEEVPF